MPKKYKLLRLANLLLLIMTTTIVCTLVLLIILVKKNQNDGNLINTSGKQRYLSQKISKTSILYYNNTDSIKNLEYINSLETDLRLFKKNNEILLSTANTETIIESLSKIQPYYQAICWNTNNLIHKTKNIDYLNNILEVETYFLNNMNKIVQQYENENKTEINKFIFYLSVSKMILLIVLAIFILKIIRPAIFENKKYHDIITYQNSELVKLNKDKDLFITVLAHDLKSPFNSILGFLELLENNIESNDIKDTKFQIRLLNTSANQVYNLLESLLNWAKMQSDKMPFSPQRIQFSSICNQVIDLLKNKSFTKNISLSHFVEDDIFIYADKDMVNTVLRNLIGNAIKFTKEGGEIKIKAERDKDKVLITVNDNGIGMDAETMNKLFDITQLYTTIGTKKEKGTGLGLALCKDLIVKHKGEIWVESKLGKCSSFKFTLPSYSG